MNKYDVKLCKLILKREINKDIFDFIVSAPEFADVAQAGQFAQIKVTGKTLRRPISICAVDRTLGTLRFVFQIRGEGTEELAKVRQGDMLDILAPLGMGFPLFEGKRAMLIGGGIGVPPLLQAAAFYGENSVAALGFRNKDAVILTEDFEKLGTKTITATDDGSFGYNGLVTDLIEAENADVIYACGPTPMLKAVKAFAQKRNIECYLSLEERMACGVGACLGCATKLLRENGEEYYGHVCKDGPVFNSEAVVLE